MPITCYEQESAHAHFAKTLSRGRLASTYLFIGPDGIGKRTFALKLAEALLCLESADESFLACGRCESCRLIASQGHPDLLKVARPAGKSTLPIELFIGRGERRNQSGLCHDISLKPMVGRRRVALIDDADDLSVESANCLLKTLEEPPPRSLLILLGTALGRQLPTIRSRSQIVRFDPLSSPTVERLLCEQSLLSEDHDPRLLAARAEGSVTQALTFLDTTLETFRQVLRDALGAATFDPLRLTEEVLALSSTQGADAADRRRRLRMVVHFAINHYRNLLVGEASEGASLPLPRHQHDSSSLALSCLELCFAAEDALHRNANQATLVQVWLTGLWRETQRFHSLPAPP